MKRPGRALVAGWFSFEEMGATAGDLLARDVVREWLDEAGMPHDVAAAKPFTGDVDWQTADPGLYSHVVFICGPFGNGWPLTEFLPRFAGSELVGVDLTMLQSLEEWNPFDLLLERDSSRTARPDVSFLSKTERVPIVGLVRVHPQEEYGDRGTHGPVHDALDRLLATRELAVVPIDTRLDVNMTGLRTPAEVETLISRMDVVVTTRLHGLVLALKNGVPALAVDPIRGGAKILRQAKTLGWPHCFEATVTMEELESALEICLSPVAREDAGRISEAVRGSLASTKQTFVDFVSRPE